MKKLKLFLAACAAMVTMGVQAQTSPTAGVEVAPGDYYIYNIGSGMYMSKGSSYGTHATVDGAGCVITISGTTDAYALHFAGIDEAKYLGDAGWTDNATSAYTWSFESATVDGYSNVYKIKDNDKGTYLYWANLSAVDWANEVMVGELPATLSNGYFILIPKDTREDISQASTAYPVDVTYLVKDPDIEASVDGLKWSGDFKRQNSAHAGYSGNYMEKWVDSANPLGNFSANQTLSGLPAGSYRLAVAATAERQGQNIDITGTYIFAGSKQTEVSATNTYTVDFTTDGSEVQIGMKTVSTTANWVNFDKVRLYYLGVDKSISGITGADYTTQGSEPMGGHTYVLYNETGKFLYNDGVTPRISSTQATFYTLETTGEEFYIRSDAGLLYKQNNSNWNTWTNGGYGNESKWSSTLVDGKYKLQNHNKAADTHFFAPNSDGENIQCYSDKTNLTGWYFIDVNENKNVAISLLYALQQAEAEYYTPAADSDAKRALGVALNNVFTTYVQASTFTSETYDDGVAAIQAAIDAYFAARFSAVDGTEGGEDITSWLTNPTPTSNGDGWTMSQTPAYDGGKNVAEYWNKSGASLSQTINLPQGYYRLTAIALTRTGMNAPLTVTGATDGALNSMNIATVASSVVNNLAGANTWFNSGYGINELDFYVPTRQDVTISLTADNSRSDYWLVWRSFQLTAVGNAEENLLNLEQYLDDKALTRANALLNNDSYVHVNGTERTDLQNAVTALTEYAGTGTISEKVDERKALKYALVAPYNTMAPNSVCIAYDEYYYQKEVANSLGIDVSSMNVPTTASEATAIAHNLNISLYNKVASDYKFSLNGLIGDFGSWEGTATVNGQAAIPNYLETEHWSGSHHAYYEQASNGWGSDAWTIKYEKKCTLPAGSYVIKVAARSSVDTQSYIKCSATSTQIPLPNVGGAPNRGINTSGVASWSDEDTFANGNIDTDPTGNAPSVGGKGTGWQWRFLPFTLDTETEVTMTFYAEANKKYNWMSIADGELLSVNDVATSVAYDEAETNTIEDVQVANVTMTRNIKAGYNTVCLPFTLTANQVAAAFGTGTEVYAFSENSEDANNATVNFTKGDGSITANVPVLVKATSASTSQTFTGVQVVAADEAVVPGKNFDFVGVYAPINPIPAGDYFIGNGALYKSAGATSMKAFRAYIKAKTAGGSVKMFIDGENVDAIDAINGEAAEQGAIYNIAGQRVNKAQKGIYIVNGKKVIVK